MAFVGPWEIALILIVVVLLFGGKKLPELAKSIGEAIREYRKSSTSGTPEVPKEEEMSKSEEETLLQTAKKLGIKTKGKTPKEISEEILKRAK